MKSSKIVGILMLLLYVCIATALLNDAFIKPYNLQNLLRSSSMFAIIGIGAALVIVTGGISLATGSLIGLVGCTMTMVLHAWMKHPPGENGSYVFWMIGLELLAGIIAWIVWDVAAKRRGPLEVNRAVKVIGICVGAAFVGASFWMQSQEFGPWLTMAAAIIVALYLSIHLGLLHGLLITKLKLQPFVVTLCGLMCYRGISRYLTSDQTQGLGTEYNDSLRLLAIGKPCTVTFVVLLFSLFAVLYGIWKLMLSGRDSVSGLSVKEHKKEGRVWALVTIAVGLILGVIASSRYWDGWSEFVKYGDAFANFGGQELRYFTLDLPQSAIDRPAELMGYAIFPLVLAALLLVFTTAKSVFSIADNSRGKRILNWAMPMIAVLVGLVGIFSMKAWIGDEAVTLSDMGDAGFTFGVNSVLVKMLGVFFFMAVLTGGALWLGKAWTKGAGLSAKVAVVFVGFFSVLWLLSMTAIHETVVQTPFFILLVIGAISAIFLNKTVYGRYLLALGNNREAAKYSGINTDNMEILAYTLCAFCGGIGAVLFTLDSNNVEPSGHGSFYELYAIAAAVLGGCSLRGGEGSILGVIIGASIMRVLYNAPDMIGVRSQLEMFTIGIVILIGVIVDETTRRWAANQDRKVV